MRISAVWALAAICLSCATGVSAAEDSTVVGELELYPNFETLSVYAFYSGDANSNNSVRMEYRRSGEEWRQGHKLTRIYGNQWTGSVFWLSPATEYEVRVSLDDPDGIDKEVLEAKTVTRDDKWPVGGGKTIHVSPGGTGDGTKDAPMGSISAATGVAEPGDTVLVAAGVYREEVVIERSGTPEAYIHVKAEKGAVLDGSDAGFLDRSAPYKWERTPNPYDYVADCDWPVDYVALNDSKLYGYESLEEMKLCRSGPPGGWYQDSQAGKLHVHVTKAWCSPSYAKTVVSRLSTGLTLEGCRYVVVDGFEIRYFGKYGIRIKGSDNVIQNCFVHHEDAGIDVKDKKIRNTTIQHCDVYQTNVSRWPWHMTKATRYEVDGIGARAGRGTVIRHNEVHGSFDGIGLSIWEHLTEPGWMQDTDVNDNHVWDFGDDGCEPEGTCTNLRFWNNRVEKGLMTQEIAPVTVGPCYMINDAYFNGEIGILKIKSNTSGVVFLYNCTFVANGYRQSLWDCGGYWDNIHFCNCIFYGTDYVFRDTGTGKEHVTFDYNCFYSTRPGGFIVWLDKEYGNLAEFQQDGYDEHAISADPRFVDIENSDFNLRADSPLIDKGVHVPGINDDYSGAAPDIGAHEFTP